MTDPGDGGGATVLAEGIDVGHSGGKRSKRMLTVQHRGETHEIESDARPVRRAPEARVEIPEGTVQTGSGGNLATLHAPREPSGEDGQQEKCEPKTEELLRPHSRPSGHLDTRRHLKLGVTGSGEKLQQVVEEPPVPPLLEIHLP